MYKIIYFLFFYSYVNLAMSGKYVEHFLVKLSEDIIDPVFFTDLNQCNTIVLRQGDNGFQSYHINTAYELYVQNSQPSVITREPIPKVQQKRISIYKQYFDTFPELVCTAQEIDDLFVKYLRGSGLSPKDRLKLKRWLVFDSSDAVFSNLGTKLSQMSQEERDLFAQKSAELLADQEIGTWIIRPSSIKDDERTHDYIRTISAVTPSAEVKHIRILHRWGIGFGIMYSDKTHFFPSLVDVLEYVSKSSELKIDLKKFYRVPRGLYIFR